MTYLILDIETLGTKPGSVITEIGAFFFKINREGTGYHKISSDFHLDISILSCLEHHLQLDSDTILFREKTGNLPPWDRGVTLTSALTHFNQWITGEVREHRIEERKIAAVSWGLDFDLPLLRCAALSAHIGLYEPWHYANQICARSVWKQAFGSEKAPPRTHRALQDCEDEARDFCKATTYLEEAIIRQRGTVTP